MTALFAGADLPDLEGAMWFVALIQLSCICFLLAPFVLLAGLVLIRRWNVRNDAANPPPESRL